MSHVSVIIPLHNKGPYVVDAIRSLLAQSFQDWEALVVENGSCDDGPDSVKPYASEDTRINLLRPGIKVSGPCSARNYGLEMADGEWLLFLDADDWIEVDHLETLVRNGSENKADVVAGGWQEFRHGHIGAFTSRSGPGFGETSAQVLDRSFAAAPWAVHAALIRKEWLLRRNLNWPAEMDRTPSEDSVFWFRVLQDAILVASSGSGAIYRKETPGHRDVHYELARWTEAILKVVDSNSDWLVANKKQPSSAQIESVIRTFESLWLSCKSASLSEPAMLLYSEMEHWLELVSMRNPGMALRRLIGISRFNQLRKVCTR